MFLIFCALLLLLGLLSFDANDPSINYVKSGASEVKNKAGLFGAYAAGLLNDFFGVGALLWPCVFAVLGIAHISTAINPHWWRWCGFFLLTLCLLACASSLDLGIGDLSGGGMVGNSLLMYSVRYLSPFGSFMLWLFVFLTGLQLSANFSWISLGQRAWNDLLARQASIKQNAGGAALGRLMAMRPAMLLQRGLQGLRDLFDTFEKRLKAAPERLHTPSPKPIQAIAIDDDDPFAVSQDMQAPLLSDSDNEENREHEEASLSVGETVQEDTDQEFDIEEIEQQEVTRVVEKPPVVERSRPGHDIRLFTKEFVLPSFDLLDAPVPAQAASPKELEAKGRALMACFNDFDIQGELARITPGPVVTMFEVRPAPGIRVSRISNLSDDLGRALKAVAIRIQAPIPGTDTVGIEIPNDNRELVNFRELVESSAFQKGTGNLGMILGKDIAGHPFMTDLAKMPHMLVAGATGAGKSVCLNAILISLLYRMPPDKLRLLLVDPKRIEMAVYADLPHLVHPVVTEMEDATNALAWAVSEMENRFKIFMRLGVRNIGAYHDKLASFGGRPPESLADLGPLPYMVIVIDELADLMLTAAREVEGKIQRLAQLARAAGIHMILATQRPSVDVVTGLIKAQFPCRISFQVSSRHDSRTILDEMGAEHLLGRGDMLFKPAGGRLLRLHGPFLSDEEVQRVVEHWKKQQAPDYQVDFSQWGAEAAAAENSVGGDASSDTLYDEARAFVLEQSKPSISLLQRHLRIGYNRAARLMEHFRREGIVDSKKQQD